MVVVSVLMGFRPVAHFRVRLTGRSGLPTPESKLVPNAVPQFDNLEPPYSSQSRVSVPCPDRRAIQHPNCGKQPAAMPNGKTELYLRTFPAMEVMRMKRL
jgi:hypothetical protein